MSLLLPVPNGDSNAGHPSIPAEPAQPLLLTWIERILVSLSFLFTCITQWSRKEIDVTLGPSKIWQNMPLNSRPLLVLNLTAKQPSSDTATPSFKPTWASANELYTTEGKTLATTADNFSSSHFSLIEDQLSQIPQLLEENRHALFLICMDSQYGQGKHAVGCLINPDQREIVFLDSKGHDPAELKLQNSPSTDHSCAYAIDQILLVLSQTDPGSSQPWKVYFGPNWQKPNDCTICMAVLAKKATETQHGQSVASHLHTVIKQFVHNYTLIDQLRKEVLQPSSPNDPPSLDTTQEEDTYSVSSQDEKDS